MIKLEKFFTSFSVKANWIAAAALIAMMLLTTTDVILRIFKSTIPGTYEIVGLLGSMVISFSLAYTSIEKGHIAVEFLLQKLPKKVGNIIDFINSIIATILFGGIAWQCLQYGIELKKIGQVSMTVQMPTYPFVFGIAFGTLLLCPILLLQGIRILRGIEN